MSTSVDRRGGLIVLTWVLRSLLLCCLGLAAPAWAALYAEYRFEETSYNGTAGEVTDMSGNGHHGRIVGAPTTMPSSTASGYTGRGMYVPDDNGSSTSNALDTGIDINDLGSQGTITFWYKRTATDNGYVALLDASSSSLTDTFVLLREGDTATYSDLYGKIRMGGVLRTQLTLDMIFSNNWTYVAFKWKEGTGFSFLTRDGSCNLIKSDSYSSGTATTLSTGLTTLYVGDNRSSNGYSDNDSANGTFDTVRIYDHQMTDAETAYDCASVAGLDHLEVTASSGSGTSGSSVVYTIKACADASCSTLFTNGVTGTLSVVGAGLSTSYTTGASFSIANGASSTTETVVLTGTGTALVSLSSVKPTAANSTPVYCGLGSAASSGGTCNFVVSVPLHHMELTAASNTTLTCQPVTYTVKACADAASPCTPYSLGVTGNLSVTGTTVNYPSGAGFSIGAGSSSTTVSAHATTVGTATATLTGLSSTPTNSPTLFCGMGATASSGGSCAISVASSGLQLSVPTHRSGVAQTTATIKAVRSSDNAQLCLAAFSGTKTINLKCTHNNPTSTTSTMPVLVNGVALNAGNNAAAKCDTSGANVSLSFDSNGLATLSSLQYKDVGSMQLAATYTGSGSDAGLSMTGNTSFVVAPYDFGVGGLAPNASASPSGCSTSLFMAGCTFQGTVTARNSLGTATPNFGKESVPEGATLSFTRTMPASGSNGSFSGTLGSFTNGVATSTSLAWTEVGKGDITATLASGNYLSSGLPVTGASTGGSAGIFYPHHFGVSASEACGSFTYSGQPFGVTITAYSATGGVTTNYAGSGTISAAAPVYPAGVTLSNVSATAGSLSNATIAATSFSSGVATISASGSSPMFTFTSKLTAASVLNVRATDAYPASGAATSSGHDGSLALRSGWLKLFNAFGSEKSSMTVYAQIDYWNGRAWVLNNADSCTTSIPASAMALSGYLNYKGAATTSWTTSPSAMTLAGGHGSLTLTAPSPAGSLGSVSLAVNLGATTTDQSCLSAHPNTTGANLTYLRSRNGSCATSYDRDPSARVTFGVYAPETRKVIEIHDMQ